MNTTEQNDTRGRDNEHHISETVREHMTLCEGILREVERENQRLRSSEEIDWAQSLETKKGLLQHLNESLDSIRDARLRWESTGADDRARMPGIPALLRQAQDLIMKIIVLDRENEQAFLRRGLLAPRNLPPANRQRPHFVAELYRKNGSY